jgi:hypothetical protein
MLILFNSSLTFKWQICYKEFKYLLNFTINIPKSHINLSALCNPCAKIAWYLSEMNFAFLCADSGIQMRASSSSRVSPSLLTLRFSSNPTNKYLRELGPEIQTALPGYPFRITHIFVFTFFSLTVPVISTPKLLTSSWITLYVHHT